MTCWCAGCPGPRSRWNSVVVDQLAKHGQGATATRTTPSNVSSSRTRKLCNIVLLGEPVADAEHGLDDARLGRVRLDFLRRFITCTSTVRSSPS